MWHTAKEKEVSSRKQWNWLNFAFKTFRWSCMTKERIKWSRTTQKDSHVRKQKVSSTTMFGQKIESSKAILARTMTTLLSTKRSQRTKEDRVSFSKSRTWVKLISKNLMTCKNTLRQKIKCTINTQNSWTLLTHTQMRTASSIYTREWTNVKQKHPANSRHLTKIPTRIAKTASVGISAPKMTIKTTLRRQICCQQMEHSKSLRKLNWLTRSQKGFFHLQHSKVFFFRDLQTNPNSDCWPIMLPFLLICKTLRQLRIFPYSE